MLTDSHIKLFYNEGRFDTVANFHITRMDSCIVKNKDGVKIIEAIQEIDFKKEYYFTEIGLDVGNKFLFEYSQGNEYHAFERGLYNDYNHDRTITAMYFWLTGLKNKYLR